MISTTKNPSSTNGGGRGLELPKLYEVEVIGEDDDEPPFGGTGTRLSIPERKQDHLFPCSLAGTLNERYSDVWCTTTLSFPLSIPCVRKIVLVFKNLLSFVVGKQAKESSSAPNTTRATNISTKGKWI